MRIFFFWMLFSSGLGFLKVLALAKLLAPADFGHYVSIFGAATLSGILLSLGLVEGTTKRYPRMWISGRAPLILADARHIAWMLGKRFLAVTAALALLAGWLELRYSPLEIMLAGVVGLAAGTQSLVASVLRASDSPSVVQQFAFTRSALSSAIACAGGWLFAWQGAVAGEAVAAVLSLVLAQSTIRFAFKSRDARAAVTGKAPTERVDGAAGAKVYWATLFSSSTALADRAFINAVAGPAAAGTYGVLALIFQVGQLLVNILAQRVGPLIIKAGFAGGTSHGSAGSLRIQAGGLLLIALLIIGTVLGLKVLDFPPGFFAKYSISSIAIVLAGLVCVVQIYALLEFHLLANDREDAMLGASAIASLTFFGLFTLGGLLHLPLEWFVCFVLLARAVHVAILVGLIKRGPARSAA